MNLSFTVYGTPVPQGSMKAFTPKGWSRAIITSDNTKLKPWRQQVSQTALEQMAGAIPSQDAIRLTLVFYFARPKSTPERVLEKITKPDLDKCVRAIKDALKGIVYVDDSHVTVLACAKQFGLPERVEIDIETRPVKREKQQRVLEEVG